MAHLFDRELPALTGTPKQIAWATDIRAGILTGTNSLGVNAITSHPRLRHRLSDLGTVLARPPFTTAEFWINRARRGSALTWEITKALKAIDAERADAAEQEERQAGEPETDSPAQMIATMRAAGRTVRQIAAAIGCAISTVYRWARGIHRPGTRYATALAALA